MSIECPNPAYYKIVNNSDIYNKILERGHLINYEILLNRSIYFENCEKFFDKERELFFNQNRKISEKSETSRKIVELENEFQKDRSYMSPEKFEKLLIKYPSFLGKIVLEEEIFNYEKYHFSNQRSLEESITSFCIGEREVFSHCMDEYVWRTKDFKNSISRNIHGDLYAIQKDVSGKSRIEKTLFGDNAEIFDTIKEMEFGSGTGISAYQDWSQFLVSLLKYSEYLGKRDLNEIVNWKETLKKAGGGSGTATAEAMFGSGINDFQIEMLMEVPVLNDKIEKLENFPLSVYSKDGSSLPYVENDKMFYLRENKNGKISLEKFSHIYKNKKFSIALEYCEEDLTYALTATYKYFARDRSLLPKIMDYFNKEDKSIPALP